MFVRLRVQMHSVGELYYVVIKYSGLLCKSCWVEMHSVGAFDETAFK